ncbi:hypothetical protein GCM10027418_22100 [Mariniluteicoccus endophyticus]
MGIDVNANVGESFGIWSRGDDDALWKHVTTAAVACGFHAGDAPTMRRCVDRIVEHDLRLCGLVGYRDLAGFGNRFLDVAPDELAAEVVYQLGALDGLALVAGGNLSAVRLAGALGTTTDKAQVEAVVAAVAGYDPKLVLLTASDAYTRAATARDLPVQREVEATPDPAAAVAAAKRGRVQTVHVTAANAARVAGLLKA